MKMEKEIAQFRLIDYRIVKSILELNLENGEVSKSLTVKFGFPSELKIGKGIVTYPMSAEISDEKNALRIEVDILGNFEFDNQIDDKNDFINVCAPATLFPYLRAHVSTLSCLSGIKPVVLPTLNMTQNKD